MTIRTTVASVLLLLALAPGVQPSAAAPLQPLVVGWERYFTIDWHAGVNGGHPVVYGRIYNNWGVEAANVRLLVDAIDERGVMVSQTVGWLAMPLTPGTTAPFEVAVDRDGASYRVRVFAFDWAQRGRGFR